MQFGICLLFLFCSSNAAGFTPQIPKDEAGEDVTEAVPVIVKLQRDATRIATTSKERKTFYSATLSVGGPSAQEFKVGFDLGGGTTLLPSKECTQNACKHRKKYDKWASTMAEDVQRDGKLVVPGSPRIPLRHKRFLARDVGILEFHSVELGDGKGRGGFVRDKVCINVQGEDPKCFPFAFLAAKIMTDDPFVAEPYDGIVGLGLGTGGALSNDFDFLDRIVHAVPGNTKSMFGLYLGSKDGEIAFGGYDRKRLSSPIMWAPVVDVDDGRWQVSISAIRVANETLDVCSSGKCLAALDHGTSLLSVPSSLGGNLAKQISSAGPRHCQESTIPDLQLVLNGVTLTVPVHDYSSSRADGHFKSSPCSPDMEVHNMDASMSPGNHLFILGESVLRRYYTVYDAESKRVGFSLAAKDDEDAPKKLRNTVRDDMTPAIPDAKSKDESYVVLLVQVKVTSSKTRSSLGLVEDLVDDFPDPL